VNQFEELQTFVRVVESGSISGAAERLAIAKSAVSRRVSDLEQRLRVQLFRRTTRRLNLTDSGKSFYQRAVQILADLEEAELAVSQQHGALTGHLKIAAPLSFGLLHLGPAIIEFNQRHPGIQFDVDFNDRQIDLLAEGFDMAIRIAQLPDSSFIARPIASVQQILCASPDYLKHHDIPKTPEDLADHQCLGYSYLADPGMWKFLDPERNPVSVKVSIALLANNGDFLRAAAIAGKGIIFTPDFIVYKAIQNGELIPLLEQFRSPGINAYAIYPQTRHLSYRVRAFVDFLIERFEGLPYWSSKTPIN
jgi:DNA-binding transcriptional LysR family regulator